MVELKGEKEKEGGWEREWVSEWMCEFEKLENTAFYWSNDEIPDWSK